MNLRTRRIIMISFFLIFIIGAPILILYSSGYRYNFKKRQITKNGLFIIKTKPKDASVYLNGERQKGEAFHPGYTRITDLSPNKYTIEVKKDGYLSWSKNLPIIANQTTFAEEVIIFKRDPPWQIIDGPTKLLVTSPDKQKIAAVVSDQENDDLYVYSARSQKAEKIIFAAEKIEKITWSPSSNKMILKTSDNFFVLSIDNQKTENLQEIVINNLFTHKKKIEQVKWHESNDSLVYGVVEKDLYEVNLILGTMKLISANLNISDYIIKDDKLLVLDNSIANKSLLIKSNLKSLHRAAKTITLPHISSYRFINPQSYYLNLLDEENQILYLFDYKKDDFSKPDEIISGVKNAIWSSGKNWLMYYNDFEVWIFKMQEKDKTLLTRISQTIKEATWLAGYPYVLFIVDDKIKIIEEDGRDRRNIFELLELNGASQLATDEDGKNIFLAGKINELEGVFALGIRD